MPRTRGNRTAVTVLLVAIAVAASVLVGCSGDDGASRQEQIAQKGASVMPFDLDKTHHTFEQNPAGGVETVRALDPQDGPQIDLIRTHLKDEADKFAVGDFSDPISIHGTAMPGMSALSVAGTRLRVSYAELQDGASITFASDDSVLVAAIHDWFNAQVSDHGAHASTH